MPHEPDELTRRCNWVQPRLGPYADGDVRRLSAKIIRRHVGGCVECRAALDAVELLQPLEVDTPVDDPMPPPELLDSLLAKAREPSLAQRVAVPARGAMSGARPGLSFAAVLVVALTCVGLGFLIASLVRSESHLDQDL